MTSADSNCILSETEFIEEGIQLEHRLDSLILLVYVILLVVSVITIWAFKHRRFRYFHESALSVIYGLIVGVVLRYGLKPLKTTVEYHDLSTSDNCSSRIPPQKLILRMPLRDHSGGSNLSISFQYGFEQLASMEIPLNNKATFNPEIFFNVLLPPIIFTAGYSMKRRHFFRNIGAILTYAFIGTFLSALFVGLICFTFTRLRYELAALLTFSDCLFFGAIISATDPVTVLAIFNDLGVDVDLYALVFGESVLNDALAITLSQSVEQYSSKSTGIFDPQAFFSSVLHFLIVFSGSFGIGVVVGAVTALLTKFTHIQEHPLLETAFFVLMSYSTFLLSETVGFTGIVAVLFCGIMQAHYTFNNLSDESKLWTKQFFELLDFLAENFVFAYIGVSTFTFQQHYWDVTFVFIALVACVIARAGSVYPLSALVNFCRNYQPSLCCKRAVKNSPGISTIPSSGYNAFYDERPVSPVERDQPLTDPSTKSTRIPLNVQHMLFFSGLRGAMAFSLAIRNTSSAQRRMFFSTTIVVVMTTVFLCGCLSVTLLGWLNIAIHTDAAERRGDKSGDPPPLSPRKGKRSRFNRWWVHLDRLYLMPLLTHRGPPLTESVPWCCQPLARLLTTQEQYDRMSPNENADTQACVSPSDVVLPVSPKVLFLQETVLADRVPGTLQLDTAEVQSQSYQHVPLIRFEDDEMSQSNGFGAIDIDASKPDEIVHPQSSSSNTSKDAYLFVHQRLI